MKTLRCHGNHAFSLSPKNDFLRQKKKPSLLVTEYRPRGTDLNTNKCITI